jgi:16S rRNA (cytosine1402-N4)-methyltransferase
MTFSHVPVLLHEVLDLLQCRPGNVVVDATVGGAGHALPIIKRITPGGMLIGIDRDPNALRAAESKLKDYQGSYSLLRGNFVSIKEMLAELEIDHVDGILMDLGVSSHQLDEASRGFSFRQDSPLDMRMDPDQKFSAHDVVNRYSLEELTKVIRDYGEERWAKRIAEFILDNRPVNTTGELERVIKMAIPKSARAGDDHPARRTFQGIRIEVNQEISLLSAAIKNAAEVLKPGGRLCIISFHSLEDRVVKHTFRHLGGQCECPPEYPSCVCNAEKKVKILTSKPIIPGLAEQNTNPRSKSAKLRACHKL